MSYPEPNGRENGIWLAVMCLLMFSAYLFLLMSTDSGLGKIINDYLLK